MNYLPPHQPPNIPGSSHYMQTAYGPTGLTTGLPPQSHQYPHVNRKLPFLATLYLHYLLRILNDLICHSPQWPSIPAKPPSDIPKFNGKLGEDPKNHVLNFHLWCSSNSLMDDYSFTPFSANPHRFRREVVYRITTRLLHRLQHPRYGFPHPLLVINLLRNGNRDFDFFQTNQSHSYLLSHS
jgi:hypothetical protein